MSATVQIFLTATSLDPDTGETQTGWIDPTWSMTQLHADRDDVAPLEFDPEFDDSIESVIEEAIGGIDSEENGTYYGSASVQSSITGLYWNYCAHVTR